MFPKSIYAAEMTGLYLSVIVKLKEKLNWAHCNIISNWLSNWSHLSFYELTSIWSEQLGEKEKILEENSNSLL